MSVLIQSEIQTIKDNIKILSGKSLADDRAFSYLILKYVFKVDDIDQEDCVTDGSNDGGIDFIYYDEEESKVILCQSKYTAALSYNDIIAELDKMYSTVNNFRNSNTGMYNDRLKRILQNALDRLPEENSDNIEYNVFTTASVDINGAISKINNTKHGFPADAVRIFIGDDIEKEIKNSLESLDMVEYEKIQIDKPKNYLAYESDINRGIMLMYGKEASNRKQ